MNQEKIGKLIAKMRKQKDLTQRELGEMVGVGYRSVSKWERGLTMPDISIINELSTILGISSDELLNGELQPKGDKTETPTTEIDSKLNKKSNKRKLFLLIVPLLMIIVIIGILIIRNNNKPVEYIIKSLNPDEYLVDGTLVEEGNNIIIKVKKIEFQDYNFSNMIIKGYDYNVFVNNDFIFGIGGVGEYGNLYDRISIKMFSENFVINYDNSFIKKIDNLNDKQLIIKFNFITINDEKVEKDIYTTIISN